MALVNPFREGPAGGYFVGREPELARFERALTALKAYQPSHMYVAGTNGRGKTSYLAKLIAMSQDQGIIAVRVALDGGVPALQQITSLVQILIREVDTKIKEAANAPRLATEWAKGASSSFNLRAAERLQNDHVLQDLSYIHTAASEQGFEQIVICIDEGERIEPYALSALKNALLSLSSYLVVVSLRLADDLQDPVSAGRLKLEEIAAAADRDIGAARIFAAGVGLGAFSAAQAHLCITRRLEDNEISFDDEVVDLIARVAEGLPDRIIKYAHDVYDHVADLNLKVATRDIFKQTFIARHYPEISEASAIKLRSTSTEQKVLGHLSHFNGPATAEDLAKSIYSSVNAEALGPVAEALVNILERFCESAVCAKTGEHYTISDPVKRYALEISMGSV